VAVGVTAAGGAERPDRAEQGRRLLDEAVRLLDAVQSVQAGDARGRNGADGDPAGHAAECRWCPVCRGVAALRELDPDAVTRVATAVGDLAGAVRDLLSGPPAGSRPDASADAEPGPAPARAGTHGEGPPQVQRIVVGE
jgi:hypothetical protein